MIYVYLHGFNSSYDTNNPKVADLQTLGEVVGITYNSFATYDEIFKQISHEIFTQIYDRDDIVFVGTSLGGFWAAEMGREFNVPSVIINPCCDPYKMLRKYVGLELTNYNTGEVNTLSNETVETYPISGLSGDDERFTYLPLVLLDMGDEIIDSNETVTTLSGFPMCTWPDGSHRFDHMNQAVGHIRQYVNHYQIINLD